MFLGIGLIVVGVLVIAASKRFAEGFAIGGDSVTRFLGLGDDVASRYRRWAVAVVIGLAFIAGGAAMLGS